jgi:uracil-DNA glycosylase
MSDDFSPIDTARQLLALEEFLGEPCFLPRRKTDLPELAPTASAQTRAAAAQPTRTASAEAAPLPAEEKAPALAAMNEKEVSVCTKCALAKTRTNTVFGEGDACARLVFVGEGPGADEDASGRPFVGRAGELLTKMITAMGLAREQVFICNVVKCRPPGNRAPAPEEVEACWDYLLRQLQIIRPEVIVTLGNPATQNLLQTRTGITRLRGTWQELPDHAPGLAGTAVMPTFHPSYVLRQYTPETRGKVWSDLQQVMERLGMDVPQRRSDEES